MFDMREFPFVALLLLLSCKKCTVSALTAVCRDVPRNTSAPVRWTNLTAIGNAAYVCEGNTQSVGGLYYTLPQCQVTGYTHINWFINKENAWRQVDMSNASYFKDTIKLDKYNSCLSFTQLFKESNSGLYKCVAEDSLGNQISQRLHLHVQKCDKGVVRYEMKPPRKTLRLLGTSVSLLCKGFFGQPSNGVGHVAWRLVNGSQERNIKYLIDHHVGEFRKRYTVTRYTSDGNMTVALNLTIVNITEKDYRDYRCHLSSSKDTRIQMSRNASLVKGDPDDPDHVKFYRNIGLGIGGGVLGVVLLLIVVAYVQRVEIKLYWMYHVKSKPPSDDKENDVAIIFNDDDEDDSTFVHDTLRPHLTELGFSIYDGDCYLGRSSIQTYNGALESSRKFLVVLTPAALSTPWCQLKCEEVLKEHGKTIIFILFKNIDKETWGKDEHSRSIRAALRVIKNVQWPRLDSEQTKFWKKLQLHLPVVERSIKSNVRPQTYSSSSGRPLLSSSDQADSGKGSSDMSVTSDSTGNRVSTHSSINIEDDVFLKESPDIKSNHFASGQIQSSSTTPATDSTLSAIIIKN